MYVCRYLCIALCMRQRRWALPGAARANGTARAITLRVCWSEQRHGREPSTSQHLLREEGSAPKRGRHSTLLVSTRCICAAAAWWFDNPHQKVVPRP